jgi:hypothetical protein
MTATIVLLADALGMGNPQLEPELLLERFENVLIAAALLGLPPGERPRNLSRPNLEP